MLPSGDVVAVPPSEREAAAAAEVSPLEWVGDVASRAQGFVMAGPEMLARPVGMVLQGAAGGVTAAAGGVTAALQAG